MGNDLKLKKTSKKVRGKGERWGDRGPVGSPRWVNDLKLKKKHQKKWGEYVSGEELGVLDGEMICNWKKHQKRWGERWRVRSWSLIYRLWTAEPITKNPFMKNPEILKTWFRELGFCPRLNTKILKSASQNTAENFFFQSPAETLGKNFLVASWNIEKTGRQVKHGELHKL